MARDKPAAPSPGAATSPGGAASRPLGGAQREAELRMRLALDAAAIGIWEYEAGSGKLVWDERVRAVVELEPGVEPTFDAHFIGALHPGDRHAVARAFAELLQGANEDRLSIECRIVGRRTGTVTWTAIEGQKVRGRRGRERVIGTARDVGAQRRAAEDLRRANRALELRVKEAVAERQIWADMFEGSEDPIAAVDLDLRLTAMNRAYRAEFRRLFGVEVQVGDLLEEALAHRPEVRDVAVMLWRRALQGEVLELPRSAETDPQGRVFDIKFRPLHNREGERVGAFQYSRDVTERAREQRRLREAQAALVRAQKFEALGQLTGGVAHDFNNLLQVISGNLHLLKKFVEDNEAAQKRLDNALAGVSRGAKLASQLLAFGRRQPLAPKLTNLGKLIYGIDDMLRRALGEEISLETIVSGGLWNAMVDPVQFESAVLNLAINARDAMEGVGRLTIEAGNAYLDEDYARSHEDVVPGQHVMVAVTDTGPGMSAEVMARAFEPFFSTKPEGKGTGLGLSMVYGLMKQSLGHIKIYSEAGQGVTVKLYLPRALQNETAPALGPGPSGEGGPETVLVVEDDEDVRETAVALLVDLGYRVLQAPEAASALAIVEGGAAIDLLFTDVVMPGPVRSTEMVRQARGKIPGLAVLFSSGYTENAIVHGGRLDPGVELLSKPYTREALARKVRQVLDERETAAGFDSSDRSPEPGGRRCEALNVLLVEDDEAARLSTAEMLQALGHQVVQAGSAEAAWWELGKARFDVLVVDRGLPGVSGDEVARAARERQGDILLVFATGEAMAVPGADLGGAVFLIKPYSQVDLARALASVAELQAGEVLSVK